MSTLCSDCVRTAACVADSRVMKIFAKPAIRYVLTALVVMQLCGYGAYAQPPTPTPTPSPDPLLGDQWALGEDYIDAFGAWDIIDAITGWDPDHGGKNADQDEIVIAVIDFGVDIDHEDLKFWVNENDYYLDADPHDDCHNVYDDDCNDYPDDYRGWRPDSLNDGITPNLHGTAVAGMAAAIGNNGRGVSGVNRNVSVVPVEIENPGGEPDPDNVEQAYEYARRLREDYNDWDGAKGAYIVVTNSTWGRKGDPNGEIYWEWCFMYESMGDVGILSVAAVDNADRDVEGNPSNPLDDEIPATCPSEYLINVTNTTSEDLKYTNPDPNRGAAYSDTHVDLGAPGTSIMSTLPDDSYGYYQGGTGTSFAAPHVSGAIALMHAAAPPSVVAYYKSNLGPGALQFKEVLLESADSKPGLVGEVVNGRRLNVKNAVAAMVDGDSDGIVDMLDNCSDNPNTDQDDTDNDSCGNLCDADYGNSGTVGFADFLQFAGAFGTTDEEKCHVEPIPGCTVGFPDFLFFAGAFGGVPGPSGPTAGTTACP